MDHYTQLRNELQDGQELSMAVVGSEGISSRKLVPNWAHYTECSNEFLGKKWNAVLEASKCLDFDYVLVLGSDDFINAAMLQFYFEMAGQKAEFVGIKDLYVVNAKSARVVYWRGYKSQQSRTVGAGRMLSRDLVEAHGFKLWSDTKKRGLDGSMSKMINAYCHDHYDNVYSFKMLERNIRMFDLKSDVGMNKFNDFTEVNVRSNVFFEKHFSNELLEKIKAI